MRDWTVKFNSQDEEIYTNAVSNADAADFLVKNVPRFECPDRDIERTYYFRWWTYRKHLRKTPSGWVVTEFLPDVPWAGKYNTISCPLGHQLREGRWLRDRQFLDDYTRIMLAEGNVNGPKAYACWPAWATLERLKVTGDGGFAASILTEAVRNYEAWERGWEVALWTAKPPRTMKTGFKPERGLFDLSSDREGSEFQLSAEGARPMVNVAMWAEAKAISEIARSVGDEECSKRFAEKAAVLEKNIKEKLWNRSRNFFTVLAEDGRQDDVLELHGYAPFYFGMPLDASFNAAWKYLVSNEGFSAPLGLVFPARNTSGFVEKPDPARHECMWNGPSWPYATSVALTALYRRLQGDPESSMPVSAGDFSRLLTQYARQHQLMREDGTKVLWIDENFDAFTGDWVARKILSEKAARRGLPPQVRERGKDYNHSAFCDLVIAGLCGFMPSADGKVRVKPLAPEAWDWWCIDGIRYHGREVSVLFDRDGTRYGRGKGLKIIDTATSGEGLKTRASLSERTVHLPVYPFSDPDPVPPTDEKHYPYFRFDGSSATNAVKPFKTYRLENGRIALDILPEIGGKIWGATDLDSGFDFIYRNHAVKFRNVAMRGPWLSGGIEYNFGIIGHGPYTSTPVDCLVKTNSDGSVSCFVSMTEFICRTVYQVEVRLAPGDDHFTTHTLWYNASGLPAPYYHWMNSASPVDDDMTLKFDGRHQIGHEGDAHPWPVDECGRNLSSYAGNAFGHNKSYHVVNGDNGIFGVWYPARGLGFIHENEPYDKYGRKAWIWAHSREGAIWEDLLTDGDGQYIELQSGRAFNQPRYNTFRTPFKHPGFSPSRTDAFTEKWGVVRSESSYRPRGGTPPSAAVCRPVASPADFNWKSVYGRFLRGQQAIREREDALGEKELAAALSADPHFVPALAESAFLALRRGRYRDAAAFAHRALAVDTYDPAANYASGFAAFALGDAATAKERLGLASFSAEYRNAAYQLLARIALKERDFDASLKLCALVLASDGVNRDALLAKVVALRLAGRTGDARRAAADALAKWPLFFAVRRELGKCGGPGGWAEAVANEFPQETLLEIASWYRESGLEEDALEIEAEAGDWPLARIRRGEYAAAAALPLPSLFPFRREDIAPLERAIEAHPSWKFKYYRAALAASFGDDATADRLLDAVGDESGEWTFHLYRASRRSGDARLADLKRAEALSRDWRIGRALARHYADKGEWAESAAAARRFLDRNPGCNPLEIAYANALNGCGRWRETVEFLRNVTILPSEFGDNACDAWQEAWRKLGNEKMANTYPENLGKGKPYEVNSKGVN